MLLPTFDKFDCIYSGINIHVPVVAKSFLFLTCGF